MNSPIPTTRWQPTQVEEAVRERILSLAYAPAAWEQKVKLAAAFRALTHVGMVQGLYEGTYGHISLRVPGAADYFWVNPWATPFAQLTTDDMVLLSGQGEIIEGAAMHNFAAFFTHSSIHAARPDVNCIVHTHPCAGSAFAALGLELQPIDQIGCSFFEDVALHEEYSGIIAERSQSEDIVRSLGNKHALILVNHGLLTCGSTVEQAVISMYELERTCDIQLRALASGRPPRLIPPDAARQVRSIRTRPGRYKGEWNLLMRELDSKGHQYVGTKRPR